MASCWEKYPCVTTSIHALVQQVAVSQLRHGYVWYVTGTVPEGSQPEHVDETIITKYQLSKDWRYRADLKTRGLANVEYLRHDRFYVIMATRGKHPFKIREVEKLRCARYGAKHYAPLLIPVKAEHGCWPTVRRRKSVSPARSMATKFRIAAAGISAKRPMKNSLIKRRYNIGRGTRWLVKNSRSRRRAKKIPSGIPTCEWSAAAHAKSKHSCSTMP